jgi:hypothetical protein
MWWLAGDAKTHVQSRSEGAHVRSHLQNRHAIQIALVYVILYAD